MFKRRSERKNLLVIKDKRDRLTIIHKFESITSRHSISINSSSDIIEGATKGMATKALDAIIEHL
jgi:hypothetical protein